MVTHLGAVTISYASTCTYGQFDLCTLQRVFTHSNTEYDTLSPSYNTLGIRLDTLQHFTLFAII